MINFLRGKIIDILNPEIKCNRVGHDEKTTNIKIRKSSSAPRMVVADFSASIIECKRCRWSSSPFDEIELQSFNGCSMPSEMWEKMKKDGFIRI